MDAKPKIYAKPRNIVGHDIIKAAWESVGNHAPPPESVIKSEQDFKNFAKILPVMKEISRIPIPKRKEERIRELLADSKLPKSTVDQITKVLAEQKLSLRIDEGILEHRQRAPLISSFSWRVNVIISNSHISRALQPFIEVTMVLSSPSGSKVTQTFEMNLKRFHQFRFNVSRALKELQNLEGRPALQ